MKNFVFLILLLLTGMVKGQKIERFYNQNMILCNPSVASFYKTIEKTDSGWLVNNYFIATKKLEMCGLYIDSSEKQKNGVFTWYHANGFLKSTGLYKDDKKEGIWVGYHSNRFMSDSAVYAEDKIVGIGLKWYPEGYLSDSLSVDANGKAVSVSWFSNGNIASAGRIDEYGALYGKWQYYYKQGGVSSSEIYNEGKLVQYTHYNTNGSVMNDTITTPTTYAFRGGRDAWANYLTYALFPIISKIQISSTVTVLVQFEVDEEGKLTNVEIKVPVNPEYDKIAFDIIKRSPNWIPAKSHNRYIRTTAIQSITFRADPF